MAEIVTISPNPVLNVLEIFSEFPLAGMEYKIFDVLGNLQQSGLLNGQRIEVGDLHKGLYVVQVFPKTLIHMCFVAKFIRF
jgi:hypothetical protein